MRMLAKLPANTKTAFALMFTLELFFYNYTHFVVSRVDVLFVRPIYPLSFRDYVVVPYYEHWGGLNDRLMTGPRKPVQYHPIPYRHLFTVSKPRSRESVEVTCSVPTDRVRKKLISRVP